MPLPTPPPEAIKLSEKLTISIAQSIQDAGGFIPFQTYMEQALYTPGLGYYANGLQKWGEKGDYITAPELSPFFAQCLANQVAQVFSVLPAGSEKTLLEFGAGSGQLCADLLLSLESQDALPDVYHIVDLSAELHNRQRETLEQLCPHLLPRVSWLSKLPSDPITGVVIANEVLDAMPVALHHLDSNGVQAVGVEFEGGEFHYAYRPCDSTPEPVAFIADKLQQLLPEDTLAQGYTIEHNPNCGPWIQSLKDCLAIGLVLLVDYGFPRSEYYHSQRSMGTLQCHAAHHNHSDVFWHPGLQDITAHVDFTAVGQAALDCGFELGGYTNQGNFLVNCALLDHFESQREQWNEEQYLVAKQALNTLVLPHEMGELFKVMGLSVGLAECGDGLVGFRAGDQRRKL